MTPVYALPSSPTKAGDEVSLKEFARTVPLPMRVPGAKMTGLHGGPWNGGGF